MKTKTVYVCEGCGFESENPAEVQRCENDARVHDLPPVGAFVRLVSEYSSARHKGRVYEVLECGVIPGDGCLSHRSAFKTKPPCGDNDWGWGYEWWKGSWRLVEWCSQCEGTGKDPCLPLSTGPCTACGGAGYLDPEE